MSESLTDQVGAILKVRVTSIQKLDTGFSGGILKFQTLVSQWDTEKKCQFQTLLYIDGTGVREGGSMDPQSTFLPHPLGAFLVNSVGSFWEEEREKEIEEEDRV